MSAHFLGVVTGYRDRFAQSPSFRELQSRSVRLLHVGRSLFIGLIRVGRRTDDDERSRVSVWPIHLSV